MNVSMIICAYTEERLHSVREAAASIQGQTRPPDEVILAVDNNPRLYARLRQVFQNPPVSVVLNDTRRGQSATRNVAAKVACGDIIGFLDDDAIATPQWLGTILHHFQRPDVAAVGGRADLAWEMDEPPIWFPDDLAWVVGGPFVEYDHPPGFKSVRNVYTNNMCISRTTFLDLGGFDTSLGTGIGLAGEEAEFFLRLKKKWPDAQIIYDPLAVVRHRVPVAKTRWRYFLRRCYQEGMGKGYIARIQPLGQGVLSSESRHLRRLLLRAVPSRLARFWRPAALTQVAAIALCIAAVGTGYLMGRWRFRTLAGG